MTVSIWRTRFQYAKEGITGTDTSTFALSSYVSAEQAMQHIRDYYKDFFIVFEMIERLERLAPCIGNEFTAPDRIGTKGDKHE